MGTTSLGVLLLLLLSASMAAVRADRFYQSQIINLGVLMPYPEGDSAVPQRLANEWITALRVAIEILNTRYSQFFTVHPFVLNSRCEVDSTNRMTNNLINYNVVGVVGPACSVAAKAAADILGPEGIPMVSFGATADSLVGTDHNTFFRTVYGDRYQAAAMAQVIRQFKFTSVEIYYSEEIYGQGLTNELTAALADEGSSQPQVLPHAVSPDAQSFDEYFATPVAASNETIIVFCTLPRVAEGLWRAALAKKLLNYPWWYFGSDGAVAFDLVGEGDNLSKLAEYLQGEIGMSPFSGVYNESGPFTPFLDYWKRNTYEEYPGLLTLPVAPRIERPRLYVPYLIDAIWVFYSVFNRTLEMGQTVTKENVLALLKDQRTWGGLNGVTGYVAFDGKGERYTYDGDGGSGPIYEFNNLLNITWVAKATWRSSTAASFVIDEYEVFRPGNDDNVPDTSPEFEAPPFVEAPAYDAAAPPNADDGELTQEYLAPSAPPLAVPIPAFAPSFGEQLNGASFAPAPSAADVVPPPPPDPEVLSGKSSGGGGGGLDGGDIFGIVFAVLVVLAVGAGGAFWYWKKHGATRVNFVRIL